jgi:hypothetical protein
MQPDELPRQATPAPTLPEGWTLYSEIDKGKPEADPTRPAPVLGNDYGARRDDLRAHCFGVRDGQGRPLHILAQLSKLVPDDHGKRQETFEPNFLVEACCWCDARLVRIDAARPEARLTVEAAYVALLAEHEEMREAAKELLASLPNCWLCEERARVMHQRAGAGAELVCSAHARPGDFQIVDPEAVKRLDTALACPERRVWSPEQWDATYPVGTPVRVVLVKAHDGHPAKTFDTVTRSKAWRLGHGATVVLIEGKTGGYSVEPDWMTVLAGRAST